MGIRENPISNPCLAGSAGAGFPWGTTWIWKSFAGGQSDDLGYFDTLHAFADCA